MEKKSHIDWSYFLLGLVFLLVALVSFRNPSSSLVAIVYVFASTALMKGIIELFFKQRGKQHKSMFRIVLGIFDLLMSLILFFNPIIGMMSLPFLFAIWFIVDSLFEIVEAYRIKNKHTGYYWFSIIVNCIGVVLGMMLFFNPIASAITLAFLVGIYFMISGITFIIAAF